MDSSVKNYKHTDKIEFYVDKSSDEVFMEYDYIKHWSYSEHDIIIKNNLDVDWAIKETSRAKVRMVIKKLLKKYI